MKGPASLEAKAVRQLLAGSRHRDPDEAPSNNGDAADRPNRHTFCFRKGSAVLVVRLSPALAAKGKAIRIFRVAKVPKWD